MATPVLPSEMRVLSTVIAGVCAVGGAGDGGRAAEREPQEVVPIATAAINMASSAVATHPVPVCI